MKKQDNEKKAKRLVKKAKKIRGIVMMSLLCVLMLSAATYAWFTLSNTAKISNLTMTVGDVTGLQIAEDHAGNEPEESAWKSVIEGGTFKGKLLPATTDDGIQMLAPEYNDDGAVKSTTATDQKITTASDDDDEGYWIEKTFWLRARGADGGTTNIKLADAKGIGTNGVWVEANSSNYNGTYVLSKDVEPSAILPGAAVRISFQKEDTATVYEPNSDYNKAATQVATDSRNSTAIIASTVTQTMAGVCSIAEGTDNILTLQNNTPTKITMRIWLEGGDKQCGNEIAAKNIVTQIKFVTVE